MSAFDTETLTSEINTILNKAEEPMESTNASSTPSTPRKNILNTSNGSVKDIELKNTSQIELSDTNTLSDFIPRPHTLEDFLQEEKLTETCDLASTFSFNDLNEEEELWVVDIPGTIDPHQLKGQILQLGDKSKFKIGEDRYCAINRNTTSSLTCAFSNDSNPRTFKTVNIKPAGIISIRRKLSGMSKIKLEYDKNEKVPYPKNIKLRHPFFGVQSDDNEVKTEIIS